MAFRSVILLLALFISGCASDFSPVFKETAEKAAKAASYDEALKIYAAGVPEKVTSPEYFSARGDIHFRYGEFGAAVNDYTRALKNMNRTSDHMKRGRAYMRLGYYPDAAYDFNAVIDRHGKDMYTGYVERAKAYIEMGKTKEALRDLEKVLEKSGGSAETFIATGEAYLKLGQLDKAKEYVQKAVMLESTNPGLYFFRGKLYYKTKDANQALNDMKKTLELDPQHTGAKLQLAKIYSSCPVSIYRDGKKAVKLAQEIYDMTGSGDSLITLASAYAENGEYDKAADLLEKGIGRTKDFVEQDDMRVFMKAFQDKKNIYSW